MNTRQRKVDVGRVVGLNSYELAVKSGKFSGTYQEYLDKEMQTYLDMKNYADAAMVEISKQISGITDGSTNMAEVINARDTYQTLGDRLDAKDEEMSIVLDRLNAMVNDRLVSGDVISDAKIDEDGYLIITVRDITQDHVDSIEGSRIIEMRNNGCQLQWRYKGFTAWNDLLALRDIIPHITIGEVTTTEDGGEASASISGTPLNPKLNISVPRGPAGSNGGEILDGRMNEYGELLLTVSASEFVNPDGNAYPILKIGEITTVDSKEEAAATITGTITNPVLNLWIPRGEPSKISKAWINEDGFLEFEYE